MAGFGQLSTAIRAENARFGTDETKADPQLAWSIAVALVA
jgi:hypothetical protein